MTAKRGKQVATEQLPCCDHLAEIQELKARLEEAEETLAAIRSGEVDALVVQGARGDQVFTLEGAEHAYRLFVETMDEGAATITEDGTIVYCNGCLAAMLGVAQETVVGRSIREFVAPGDLMTLDALLEAGLGGGGHGELNLRIADDASIPIHLSLNAIVIDETRSMCAVITDLTSQKRSERVLEAERLARSILEQAGEAIVVCDEDGRIIRASLVAGELAGQNPILRQFERAYDLTTEPDGRPVSIPDILRGGTFRGIEAVLRRPDGKICNLLVSAQLLTDPSRAAGTNGNAAGCVITMADITKRRQAEEHLQRTATELARSNADLEEFAHVVSHDLKEPLRGVTTFLELLQRSYGGRLDGDAEKYIGIAVSGATRADRLISDLLDYASAGGQEERPPLMDCETALEQATENLRISIEESKAVITHESLPTLAAHQVELVQLFQNLVGNAIKFRGKRHPHVHVSARQEEAAWVFSVRDDGIGMEPEDTESIFDVFRTLHSRTEYPGTGIGLAKCKKIVERHGGRIWVESAPGEGSTFYFTLPAQEAGRPAGAA